MMTSASLTDDFRKDSYSVAYVDAFVAYQTNMLAVIEQIHTWLDIDTTTGVFCDILGACVACDRGFNGLTITLDDATYVTLIRAAITRNNSHGTFPEVIDALAYIFVTPVFVQQWYAMAIDVTIGRTLTTLETTLLQNSTVFLPLPQCASIDNFLTYLPNAYFGWDDSSGALGWGEDMGYVIATSNGTWAESVI